MNIIVNCIGGLGNQMFQYAYYRELCNKYNKVYLDISNFSNYKLHNGYELEKIFGIKIESPPLELIKKFKPGLWAKLFSKIGLNNKLILQKNMNFDKKYLNIERDCYLDGYWQSEKYFANCTKEIKHTFTFPKLDLLNSEIAETIQKSNSVSIHIRLGDYLNSKKHGGICSPNYYKMAIRMIKARIKNPQFYIFSDEIEHDQINLLLPRDSEATYITGNTGNNSYKDMHLISLCKHNIIANSSFSWWGAWLNNNKEKIIIAPKTWFNDSTDTKDLIPQEWIRL